MSAKYSANLIEKELKSKPGPGAYEPNTSATLRNSPNSKIGTSTRDDLVFKKQMEFRPAPTVYNPKDSFTKTQTAAWGFGSSKRPSIESRSLVQTPAPGVYTVPSRMTDGPKYHIGGRTKDVINEIKDFVPGPG
jgi:hypothetical protein